MLERNDGRQEKRNEKKMRKTRVIFDTAYNFFDLEGLGVFFFSIFDQKLSPNIFFKQLLNRILFTTFKLDIFFAI